METLEFLKIVYRKYTVPNEHVVGSVIEELKRADGKLRKDLDRALENLCLALPEQSNSTDHWYEKSAELAAQAFPLLEKDPLRRLLALKIIITSIIMRYSRGGVREEDATHYVVWWLNQINSDEAIMACIQSTKPTVIKKTKKLVRSRSSRILNRVRNDDFQVYIYLDFVKLAIASLKFFSCPRVLNRRVIITIPSRNMSAAPYDITAGALFMNLASYILEKHLCFQDDTQYFARELTYVKDMIAFVVNTLVVPDMDGWRSREFDNATIMKRLHQKRFVRRSVCEEYVNKRSGLEIKKGEWVEIVEFMEEELYDKSYLVRRNNNETPFRLPAKCFADENDMDTTQCFDDVIDQPEHYHSTTVVCDTIPGSSLIMELKEKLQKRL